LKITEKHAKNNVRWSVVTTPNLNCCLPLSNERKMNFFFLYIFSGKIYLSEEISQIVILSLLHNWLTYLVTFKQDRVWEDSSQTQPYSFSGYTYVSPKASRVVHGIFPLKSSHEFSFYVRVYFSLVIFVGVYLSLGYLICEILFLSTCGVYFSWCFYVRLGLSISAAYASDVPNDVLKCPLCIIF